MRFVKIGKKNVTEGLGGHSKPLSGFSGEPGEKVLGRCIIFSLKQVCCGLLKIIKLKLSNKKLLL